MRSVSAVHEAQQLSGAVQLWAVRVTGSTNARAAASSAGRHAPPPSPSSHHPHSADAAHSPHEVNVAQKPLHVYASTRSPPPLMSTSAIGRWRNSTDFASSFQLPSWNLFSSALNDVASKVICHSTRGIGPSTCGGGWSGER